MQMTWIWNTKNIIMEKNFTCLYYNYRTYLDWVYMQHSKSRKQIIYGMNKYTENKKHLSRL